MIPYDGARKQAGIENKDRKEYYKGEELLDFVFPFDITDEFKLKYDS